MSTLLRRVLLVLLLWPASGMAAERVYITPVDAEALKNVEQRILFDGLVSRIVAYKAFDLLSQEAAQAIMEKAKQQFVLGGGCERDERCLASLGQLLESRYIIRPRAFAVNDEITFSIELIDTATGSILSKREYRTVRPMRSLGPDFEDTVDDVVRPLKLTGELRVVAEVPGSVVVIKKKRHSIGTSRFIALKVPIGGYGLELTHATQVGIYERILVPVDGIEWAPNQISLEEAFPPWYKKWWVWTAIGAGAAAAGVGAYYALKPEPEAEPARARRPYGTVVVRLP